MEKEWGTHGPRNFGRCDISHDFDPNRMPIAIYRMEACVFPHFDAME